MNLFVNFQYLFDTILEKNKYGIYRKNGLFCTSDLKFSKFYANRFPDSVYIVFPTDDFNFLYSPKIKNFFEYYNILFNDIQKEIFVYSNFWGL